MMRAAVLACLVCCTSACAARDLAPWPQHVYTDRSRTGPQASALRAEVWRRIGLVLFRMKEDRQALEAFSQARALDPADATTRYFEVWAHLRLGQATEARSVFDTLMSLRKQRGGPIRPRPADRLIVPELAEAIRAAENGRAPGEPEGELSFLVSEWPLPPTASLDLSPRSTERVAHYYAVREHCRGLCRGSDAELYDANEVRSLIAVLPEPAETTAQAELLFRLRRELLWFGVLNMTSRDQRAPQSADLDRSAAESAAERGIDLTHDKETRARLLYRLGDLQQSVAPARALSSYLRFLAELDR
jgi:tetratricopeptide (TPR) repeat protein